MKNVIFILCIVIMVICVGLTMKYKKDAKAAQDVLNSERYHRMLAEENLEKAKSKLAGVESELNRTQNKTKSMELRLGQTEEINNDLKSRLDKISEINSKLQKKIKELGEFSVGNELKGIPGEI